MNYNNCIKVYGEDIADYVAKRIEEDYGANGLDGFYEKDNDIYADVIGCYVEEYYDKKYPGIPIPRNWRI